MNHKLEDNSVVIHDASLRRWLLFTGPIECFTTFDHSKVGELLTTVADRVTHEGLYGAGFIAYEAAEAFDPAFKSNKSVDFPLIWFGIYKEPEIFPIPKNTDSDFTMLEWKPSISESTYKANIDKIKHYIRNGDT
jgi:para-aminobenzoate synthetase/4-amino-4-deoxychorismate lyase